MRVSKRLDAHDGRKLFETQELREKPGMASRVDPETDQLRMVDDDDPICKTKKGGASGQREECGSLAPSTARGPHLVGVNRHEGKDGDPNLPAL